MQNTVLEVVASRVDTSLVRYSMHRTRTGSLLISPPHSFPSRCGVEGEVFVRYQEQLIASPADLVYITAVTRTRRIGFVFGSVCDCDLSSVGRQDFSECVCNQLTTCGYLLFCLTFVQVIMIAVEKLPFNTSLDLHKSIQEGRLCIHYFLFVIFLGLRAFNFCINIAWDLPI